MSPSQAFQSNTSVRKYNFLLGNRLYHAHWSLKAYCTDEPTNFTKMKFYLPRTKDVQVCITWKTVPPLLLTKPHLNLAYRKQKQEMTVVNNGNILYFYMSRQKKTFPCLPYFHFNSIIPWSLKVMPLQCFARSLSCFKMVFKEINKNRKRNMKPNEWNKIFERVFSFYKECETDFTTAGSF